MKLFYYEFRKLLRCWFLWVLLAIFLAYDVFLVWDTVGRDNKLYHEIYQIIMQTGTDLTDNTDKIDALLNSKDETEAYYAAYIKAHETIYQDFDIYSILSSKFSPDDSDYYTWISHNYDKLQERVEQIRSTNEDKYAFYPGINYKVHSILFMSLLRMMVLQSLILTVLALLYLMDFERIHKTEYLTYSSKTGRNIQLTKWVSGITMGFLYTVILVAVPLILFLLCVPMQGLWETPISSFMMMQQRGFYLYPYITFVRLSFGKYLLLSLLVVFLLVLLVGIFSGAVQFFFRNSYLTMLSIGLLFMGMIALPYLFQTGFVHTAMVLNPAALWYMCGGWFIEYDPAISFAWSEFLTIGIWLIVVLLGFVLTKKYFFKIDM